MSENRIKEARNQAVDGLKAIAILAVVFYHIGVLPYGYLGVEIFFVISGFFTTLGIQKKLETGSFSYLGFLAGRIKRIMPLVILAGMASLLMGYFGMLPDDYENLSESIVASNFASQNILAAVTTGNYWDVSNDYKPLMHLWYVGVLAEFYIVYPLILIALNKLGQKRENGKYAAGGGIACLTVISWMLYSQPVFSAAVRFYYLPFRFFEFGLGGMAAFFVICKKQHPRQAFNHMHIVRFSNIACYAFIFVLAVLLCAGRIRFLPDAARLAFVCGIAMAVVLLIRPDGKFLGNKAMSAVGRRSYSIFIWHQVLLAFYRYYISAHFSAVGIVIYFAAVLLLAEASYRIVENRAAMGKTAVVLVLAAAAGGATTAASLWIFFHAGTVRDVPELDIYKDSAYRGMHAEYNERIYAMDGDFAQNGKTNVLIVGNSFARDMANILLESNLAKDINLSYSYAMDESIIPRVQDCDCLLFYGYKEEVPDFVQANLGPDTTIWGIGTKNFGESNGIIYKNRWKKDYFRQTIVPGQTIEEDNKRRESGWGQFYIELMEPVRNADGSVRVFTDGQKFISQDCTHLTQNGAKFYAGLLDLEKIVK